MAKFVYRMQNILDIKQKLERQAKADYGLANAKRIEEQQKLQKIIVQKSGYENRARELVSGSICVNDIRENKRAIESMKVIMRRQLQEVQNAERQVEAARARLQEIMTDRKTHEKLKEHAFEAYMLERGQEENKIVDELVSYTYHEKEEE